MTQYGDPVSVTRELPVPLTDHELSALGQQLAARKAERDSVEAAKRAENAKFNEQLKNISKATDRLAAAINQGCEMRATPCEERRDLDTGELVVFRLDRDPPEEVSRRPYGQDEKQDSPQASLFDGKREKKGPRSAPVVRCSAVDGDGECWPITAEQADVFDRTEQKPVTLQCANGGLVNAVKVLRGKACETCGIVAPDHRPECPEIKAADAADPDSYDRNDTSAVAAKIDEIEPPPDGPVRGVESATTKVKPKRGKRGAAGAEAE